MPDDRISLRQLLTLTFAALLSPAIQLLPGSTARRAGEAGWLATLAALPVLLGLCWLLWRLFRGGPDGGGLPNTAQQLLGPTLGRVFCLLYFLWGLYLLAANARQVALRFLTISYRNAPMVLFLLALLGVTFWLVRKPVRALARAGEVFFLTLAAGLALSLLLGAFQVDTANLLPVWVEDLPAVGWAILPVLGLLGYVIFAPCLGGHVVPEEGGRRKILRWAVGLCLTLTALQVVCLGNFGPGLAGRMDTPFFMMVKGIGFEGTSSGWSRSSLPCGYWRIWPCCPCWLVPVRNWPRKGLRFRKEAPLCCPSFWRLRQEPSGSFLTPLPWIRLWKGRCCGAVSSLDWAVRCCCL